MQKNNLSILLKKGVLLSALMSFSLFPSPLQSQDTLKPVSESTLKDNVKKWTNKFKSFINSQIESFEEQTKPLEAIITDNQGISTDVTDFKAFYRIWKNYSILPLPTQEGDYSNTLHIMLLEEIQGSPMLFNVTNVDIPFYRMKQILFKNYPEKTAFVSEEDWKSGNINIKLKDVVQSHNPMDS